MTTLGLLQRWYASQCDGDWEHQQGIKAGTLDNPGWSVVIDLQGTDLESIAFREASEIQPETDWVRCWVEDGKFHGVGGPFCLEVILGYFLAWAEGVSSGG